MFTRFMREMVEVRKYVRRTRDSLLFIQDSNEYETPEDEERCLNPATSTRASDGESYTQTETSKDFDFQETHLQCPKCPK
ncbi:hypothetical protein X801_06639, partial [Opisthorchis viverrini]